MNRSQTAPHITRILIIVNLIVFFVTLVPEFSGGNWLPALFGVSRTPTSLDEAAFDYGVIPYDVVRGQRLYTLFASMFLHADIFHIGGNMLFLYIFGDNVEDTFGHGRYLLFYLLSGIAASMAHIMAVFSSVDMRARFVPSIGASGAISGVLGAYLVLYPRARILTLVLLGWIFIVPIPAIIFLGVWFVYQFLYGFLAFETALIGIAYWAHIGGFAVGLLFGAVWRGRRRQRVF